MVRKSICLLVCLVVISLFVLPVPLTIASQPIDASGEFAVNLITYSQTTTKELTGESTITINDVIADEEWTGSISGSAQYLGRWIYQDGKAKTTSSIIIFEVAIVSVGEVSATGGLVLKSVSNPGVEAGVWTVVEATGELEGLHGHGAIGSPGVTNFPNIIYGYTGTLHFAP